MDTQNLKAFVAVAECRSFSLAADKLHITQPAISKRIQTLEQQVHSQLFDRSGRQISLTEARRTLLPHAEAVLREMQAGLSLKINLATNYLESIKALISAGYAWGVLPQSMLQDNALSVLNVQWPARDLNLRVPAKPGVTTPVVTAPD
jgi:DNA-binding transcriptional LysR family regulator